MSTTCNGCNENSELHFCIMPSFIIAAFVVEKEDQFVVDGVDYFRFSMCNGKDQAGRDDPTQILVTNAPKDLKRCPRMELNRLVRMLEKKNIIRLPKALKYMKKEEILGMLEGRILFA